MKIHFKKIFKTSFIIWVAECTCWLLTNFPNKEKLIKDRSIEVYIPLLKTLDRVLYTRRAKGLILYIKALRSQFHRFLADEVGEKGTWEVRCFPDGCPRVLRPLVDYEKEGSKLVSPASLPILETILFSTRALSCGYVFSGKTIEQPPIKEVPSSFGKYAKAFWRTLGLWPKSKVPRYLRWNTYHFTTKAGPNGHSLWSCLKDLAGMPRILFDAVCVVGGERFQRNVLTLLRGWDKIPGIFLPSVKEKVYVRKLIAFSDKEGKTREVAILDYFSQTVLKPLHQFLYKILKRIPQDRTFSQGNFKDQLRSCEVVYSVDLTAATDRFPILAIEVVLKAFLPHYYVQAWHVIMVGRPFFSKDAARYVTYRTGNPMGAYSSWATFALVHHYCIYWCCRELGKDWKTLPYCLLGDDIAIGDAAVGEKYIQLMTSLGVEISFQKSHKSSILYEFAKRLVYRGEEITHFPLSALKESQKRYYQLLNLLIEGEARGWIPKDGGLDALSSYYSSVMKFRSKRVKDIRERAYICERIMNIMRSRQTAAASLNALVRHLGYGIRELTEEESNGILLNLCVELFAESNPENEEEGKGKPLGLLATDLVCYFTSLEDLDLGFQLIEAFPLLPVYGSIEEMFLNFKKEVVRFDRAISAQECLAAKAMTLPKSDEVFSSRTKDIINLTSSIVGQKLVERLKFLDTPMGRTMLG